MDFHQTGIADAQALIRRIDVNDGLVRRAVVEPGDRMCGHRRAGGVECQNGEGERAERYQVAPLRVCLEARDDIRARCTGI